MNKQKNAILPSIALSMVKGIGHVIYKQLIDCLGSAQNAIQTTQLKSMPKIKPLLKQAVLEQDNNYPQAMNIYKQHQQAGIKIIAYEDAQYPTRLKELYSPPSLLYYEGNAHLNAKRIISIVGTRNASKYGKKWVQKLVHDLKPYEVTIVSGLAYGIDICAHEAALAENLPTIAVLAGGLDRIYPSSHKSIAKEITKQGALIAEMPVGTMPEKYNFPARNRIITGIADAVIVVEAGEKSGALITAKYAHELNREIFAVPGDIDKDNSKGCHNLIKTHQASLITNAQDLASIMNWGKISSSASVVPLNNHYFSQDEERIIKELNHNSFPLGIDQLSNQVNITPSLLLPMMLKMEQGKHVSLLPGNKCKLYGR